MGVPSTDVDSRLLPELPSGSSESLNDPPVAAYSRLQRTRAQAGQAIELLKRYAPDRGPLAAHLYALEGYSEIFLAELFCSGIPLSTVDFEGDYTFKPGSSTDEVFAHAATLFDTALALAGDSVRFVQLAHIGRARTLLNRGDFTQAAAEVAQVPDGYQYAVSFSAVTGSDALNFARIVSGQWAFTVSDREGMNGLDFRTSNDPRTRVTARGTNPNSGQTNWHPDKYAINGSSPIVLASGVEARLIEAEADLRAGGTQWLTILNTLRTNGQVARTYTRLDRRGISSGAGAPQAGSPGPAGVIDTTWGPGTGIGMIPATVIADVGPVCPSSASPGTVCTDTVWYKGLRPLTDPGTPESRVDLLFRERAFWLFLTGQRQGDLRRLVRQYGRSQESVYPVGSYIGGFSYGNDVTLPLPVDERDSNPQYDGCVDRGA
jgi:hypothetical protein